MKMIYITFTDMTSGASGSKIRPKKMYQAFIDAGVDVDLVYGSFRSFIWDKKKRLRNARINKIRKKLKSTHYDFCYIESTSNSVIPTYDRLFIKEINSFGIPIGYYYRDIQSRMKKNDYLYNDDFVTKLNLKKYRFLNSLSNKTITKYVNIVYLPSKEMFEYLDFDRLDVLPPGIETTFIDLNKREPNTCIYVGGLSKMYGTQLLIDSFKAINESGKYKLILICRENEYEKYSNQISNVKGIEVHHVSGTALKPLYERASFGVYPVAKTEYLKFAISVKLYEYISYHLPILTTEVGACSRFVVDNKLGFSVKDDVDEYSEAILRMFEENHLYEKNILNFLSGNNSWLDRAKKVICDLTLKK